MGWREGTDVRAVSGWTAEDVESQKKLFAIAPAGLEARQNLVERAQKVGLGGVVDTWEDE